MTVPADADKLVKPDTASTLASQRRGHRLRMLRWSAIGVIVLLMLLELIARFALDLGNPPLMQTDPKIEYLFQPNQKTRRFGNAIHYNAYSMRADDFPDRKSSPDELRIYMIGDSVINGGAQTDQSEIASSILQRELSEQLGRKVIVGNASASSWGPNNELEYMRRFGLLDADVLLIVMSSHDVQDVPTFMPSVGVSPDMPDRKPLCAASELITRYVLPRLGVQTSSTPLTPPAPTTQPTLDQPEVRRSLDELREMITMGRSAGARVVVAQHIERAEANGQLLAGHDLIRDAARQAGAEVVDLAPAFEAALQAGRDPWRDAIHPNAIGQRAIADVVKPVLLQALPARPPDALDTAPPRR